MKYENYFEICWLVGIENEVDSIAVNASKNRGHSVVLGKVLVVNAHCWCHSTTSNDDETSHPHEDGRVVCSTYIFVQITCIVSYITVK